MQETRIELLGLHLISVHVYSILNFDEATHDARQLTLIDTEKQAMRNDIHNER